MDDTQSHDLSIPQQNPISAEGQETIISLSTSKGNELLDVCIEGVMLFSRVVNSPVIEAQDIWSRINKIFCTLLNAPATDHEQTEFTRGKVQITRATPPKSHDWSVQLVRMSTDFGLQYVLLSSQNKKSLIQIHASTGHNYLVIEHVNKGLKVTIIGDKENSNHLINTSGTVLDMTPEAIMKREGMTLLDFLKLQDPGLKDDLVELERQWANSRKDEQPAAARDQSARKISLAFDSIEEAEKERKHELKQRLQKKEQTSPQAKPPIESPAKSKTESEEQAVSHDLIPQAKEHCAYCGDRLINGKPFCASCGKPVLKERSPSTPESKPVITCSYCEAELPLGKTFCPDCGKPVGTPDSKDESTKSFQTSQPKPPAPEPQTKEPEEPATVPAGRSCPQCHSDLKPNVKFCMACGVDLQTETAVKNNIAPPLQGNTSQLQSDACSHCGNALKAGMRFCTGCGNAITEKAPPSSPRAPDPQAVSQCSNCGNPLKSGARFCTKCGSSQGPGMQSQSRSSSTTRTATSQKITAKQPKERRVGPGMINTAMTIAPGLIMDMSRRWPIYQQDPQMAMSMLLPCLMSFVSVGLAPILGKWFSIVLMLVSLGWLSYPIFMGGDLGQHAGRGLVGGSFVYTIMRLIRMVRR